MTASAPGAPSATVATAPPVEGARRLPLPFDERAAFVAGQAKSGTTLLVALLDSHPELLALPEETAYFPTVLTKYGGASRRAQFDYLTQKSLACVLFGGPCKWGRRERHYAEFFPRQELLARFEALAFLPANAGRDLLALLLEAYAATLGRPLDSVTRWIEKTPANRDHLPAIRRRFPAAKILLTVRDPRAVFAARIALEKTRRTRRFSVYLCVAHWRTAARLALDALARQDAASTAAPGGAAGANDGSFSHHPDGVAPTPPPTLVVPYEQLVADPAAWMARVGRFLGVSTNPSAQNQNGGHTATATAATLPRVPTKAGRPWAGNSASGNDFDAVTTEPVARWRHFLSEDEIGWVEFHCRDLMPRLGYEPLLPRRALRHWARAVRGETPREYIKSRWRSLLLRRGARKEDERAAGATTAAVAATASGNAGAGGR